MIQNILVTLLGHSLVQHPTRHFVDCQLKFLNGIASWPIVCFVKLWSYLAILKTYVFSSKTHPKSRSQDTRCGSTWALVGLGVTSYNSRINTIHKPCLLASKSGIPFFPLTYRWYPIFEDLVIDIQQKCWKPEPGNIGPQQTRHAFRILASNINYKEPSSWLA